MGKNDFHCTVHALKEEKQRAQTERYRAGMGSNDPYRSMHALKKQKPQVITCGSARRKEERKNEKLNLSDYIVPLKF